MMLCSEVGKFTGHFPMYQAFYSCHKEYHLPHELKRIEFGIPLFEVASRQVDHSRPNCPYVQCTEI